MNWMNGMNGMDGMDKERRRGSARDGQVVCRAERREHVQRCIQGVR